MLGYFHYYTMVGVPSGIGAFFASFLVADRANYHYAHGLSTIVSNNIDNTVFFFNNIYLDRCHNLKSF